MPPVLGVLVAMALMALLAGLFTTCGVVAGALAFAPSDDAKPPTAVVAANERLETSASRSSR
jgi:uncharacterized membrane protein YhhN